MQLSLSRPVLLFKTVFCRESAAGRTPIITLGRQGGSERTQRLRIDMLIKQRGEFLSTGAV